MPPAHQCHLTQLFLRKQGWASQKLRRWLDHPFVSGVASSSWILRVRSVDFPELSPISMSGVSRLCIVLHQRLDQCGFPNTCNVPGLSRPDSPRITRVPAWRSLNHHDERWWHLDTKNQEQHIPSSNRMLLSVLLHTNS